jgi:DNA-directed RNA polymerase sigma subunit (sigma70/sigma32)
LGLSPDIAAKRRDAGIVPRVPTSALEVFPDWDYESEETPTPEDRFSKALPSRRYSSEEVSELLTLLRPFEASVITFRFALDGADSPRTLEEVAGALGLERERIRQLEASGFEKLRKYLLIE